MTTDKTVVYLGYPSNTQAPPSWINGLLKLEQTDEKCPFRFYLSGGSVTDSLKEVLLARAADSVGAQTMATKLAKGYTSRLVDALISPNFEKIYKLAMGSPTSTEYRILLDLWVLSRSDAYVVDCEMLGHGNCGAEMVYAHACVRTIGVCDTFSVDPWYQYHLDMLVKSPMVLETLDYLTVKSEEPTPKE